MNKMVAGIGHEFKLHFDPTSNPDTQNIIASAFLPVACLVPKWVQNICIVCGAADSGNVASIHTKYEVRSATLILNAEFWVMSNEMRKQILVHEMLHISFDPLYQAAVHHSQKDADGNPPDELRARLEESMCDLEYIVNHVLFGSEDD